MSPGIPSTRLVALLAALVNLPPAFPIGSGGALAFSGDVAAPAGGPAAAMQYARVALVENAGPDLTHYPVLVALDTGTPIALGKMRPDCGDVRFADAVGLAPLPYWLDSGCGTSATRFWVLIEDLPKSVAPKPLLVTYGNAALDSASDGATVLDAYAAFDGGTLDGWRNADVEMVIPPYPAEFRDDYPVATVDATEGRPPGSARKGPERSDNPPGFGSAGIARTLALSGNVNLTIGLDFRASSTTPVSMVTNALVAVGAGDEPPTPGAELSTRWLVRGGVTDSGWRRVEPAAATTFGHDRVTVFLGTQDWWHDYHAKTVWFDNVVVRRVANPEPAVTVLPETPWLAPAPAARARDPGPPPAALRGEYVFPDGWAHVRPITVENAGAALADHQVLVTFDSASLIAAGTLQRTCADVRFTDEDAANLLPYWIESGCGEAATRAWVRVPAVPVGTSRVHLHYGNPQAAPAADAEATFLLYDDFAGTALDSSKWRVVENGGGTIEVGSGTLTVRRAVGTGVTDVRSVASFNGSVVLEHRQRLAPSDSHYYWSSTYYGGPDHYSSIGYVALAPYESAMATSTLRWPPRSADSFSDTGDVIATPPRGVWFVERFSIPAGGAIRRSLDGAADEVATRYVGVSSGHVGLLTGAPAWGTTQTTETDWVRLRSFAGVEPSVTVGAEATPPGPPRAVAAAPGTNLGEITLSWEEPERDGGMRVRAYHVYRASASGGPYERVASEGAGVRAFTDPGRTPLVTQYYVVAAANFVGEGDSSTEACSKPFPWVSVNGDNLCALPIAGTAPTP